MPNKIFVVLARAAIAALFACPAMAADIEVKMLNKGSNGDIMVFEPASVKAAVGDVITFVPVDNGHDAVATKGMIPDGVEEFKGMINQELKVTLDKKGAYVIKCPPHFGMGMVALVVVGDGVPANLEAVKTGKLPKKARERLDAQIAELGL